MTSDSGSYEYGGDYSNTEIQRGAGFGSADEDLFPRVHVDEDGLVQRGPGLLRSDWPVIDKYEATIRRVERKLKLDGAPELRGSPYGPSNQLKAGGKKDRSFNRGVRKQMEAIIKAIDDGTKITGVEVVVGERRIDYTARMRVDKRMANVLVEYKHWTGNLSAERRTELANKLSSQLKGQLEGAGAGYKLLIVDWPAFGELDADSQDRFREVVEDAADTGRELGIDVKFRT